MQMQKDIRSDFSLIERVPDIVPMQRSRTTVEGTKPQCQPIDLRCSLRGPLLRREKNKLIERRSGKRERRNEGGKERRGEGRLEGRRGSAGRGKKRIEKENIGSVERGTLLEEESAKERNERGTKERADQRAAWWEMQSRMRPFCAQRKGRFLPRSRSCVTFARLIATSITTARWFTSDRRNERRDFGWITANP